MNLWGLVMRLIDIFPYEKCVIAYLNFYVREGGTVWRVNIDTREMKSVNLDSSTEFGYWILLDDCSNEGVYCSICHKKVYKKEYANQKLKSKFCPNCGHKMKDGVKMKEDKI